MRLERSMVHVQVGTYSNVTHLVKGYWDLSVPNDIRSVLSVYCDSERLGAWGVGGVPTGPPTGGYMKTHHCTKCLKVRKVRT